MHELTIRLTGTIQDSNFNEWKRDLIAQIQATAKELKSDEDFVAATQQVKWFKAAEKSLAQAKQSAIEQATEIQQLFGAIDEISAEARDARLSLERQIKQRKAEIKAEIIRSGIEFVWQLISRQSPDFQALDHSRYVDSQRFEQVVRGKAGTRSMELAIDNLCAQISREILEKAAEIENNSRLIERIPEAHQFLFQDRNALLSLSSSELTLTIENRVAKFQTAQAKTEADTALRELEHERTIELPADPVAETPAKVENYQVVVQLVASEEIAVEVARTVKQALESHPAITHIRLTRDRRRV